MLDQHVLDEGALTSKICHQTEGTIFFLQNRNGRLAEVKCKEGFY